MLLYRNINFQVSSSLTIVAGIVLVFLSIIDIKKDAEAEALANAGKKKEGEEEEEGNEEEEGEEEDEDDVGEVEVEKNIFKLISNSGTMQKTNFLMICMVWMA